MKLQTPNKTLLKESSSVVYRDLTPKFDLRRSVTISKSEFLKATLYFQIYDYPGFFYGSTLLASGSFLLSDIFDQEDLFRNCYDPFFMDADDNLMNFSPTDLEIPLLVPYKISKKCNISTSINSTVALMNKQDSLENYSFSIMEDPFQEVQAQQQNQRQQQQQNNQQLKLRFKIKLFSYQLRMDECILSGELFPYDALRALRFTLVCIDILKKTLGQAIANPKEVSDTTVNFMGRLKDEKDFLKVLDELSMSKNEKIKKGAEDIIGLLLFLQRDNSMKYSIIKETVVLQEVRTEEEKLRDREMLENDKRELRDYLEHGYDQSAVDKLYYELNMIRVILKLQNALQARKFWDRYCEPRARKYLDMDAYEKNLQEAVTFYNAMITRINRNKIVLEKANANSFWDQNVLRQLKEFY